MTVGKVAEQTKALWLFGTVVVNEVGIRWKDNALIRGGLTDAWVKMNHSMYHDGVKLVVRSQQRS